MTLEVVLAFLRTHKLQAMRIDSRQIQAGDVFIAVPGLKTDGRNYIDQAIANGAAAVLVESAPEQLQELEHNGVPILSIPHLSAQLPAIAAAYYGDPSQQLKIIGITGTNGKTSISHYVAQLFAAEKITCGIMGTLGNGLLPNLTPAALTTSDCCTVQQQLVAFTHLRAQFVAMEVSSGGLAQARLASTKIDTAVFTNLSQDHLDYHKDMQDYFAAKCKLFTDFAPKHCVVNIDDEHGQRILELIPAGSQVITYSLHNPAADVYIVGEQVHSPWGTGILQTNLIGSFNISNTLAALACCALQGIPLQRLLFAARSLTAVVGRMQLVSNNTAADPKVIVDYAHTPDALVKVLQALRAYNAPKLYCIFGCGGDRDRTKRPLMLRAVIENSDEVIITNDNPRTEDPEQIVRDIIAGTPLTANVTIELDRTKAIQQTIARATANDIVLIAGKGHEDYQIIGTTKYPFLDAAVAQEALNKLGEIACS